MNILLLKAWLKERGPLLIGGKASSFSAYRSNLAGIVLFGEETAELLICVDVRNPAMALADHAMPMDQGREDSNFAKALKFHLAGYRLDSIEQAGFDRSVVFSFSYRDRYGQVTTKQLRVELAGNAANAYLLSDRGMVVSIMRRRRGEPGGTRMIVTGKPLPPPPPLGKYVAQESGEAGLEALLTEAAGNGGLFDDLDLAEFFQSRVAGCDKRLWPRVEQLLPVDYSINSLYEFILRLQQGAFNNELFDLAADRSVNDVALELLTRSEKAAAKGKKKRVDDGSDETTIRQLEENLGLAMRADEVEELAALMMQAAADPPEDIRAFLEDWQAQNPDWADQIDFKKDIDANALRLSRYAQRLRRGLAKLETRLQTARDQSARHKDGKRDTAAAGSQRQSAAFARLEERGIRHSRYRTTDGIDMVVGANATSNDALLRVLGSGNHLWFHARDFAGSHVYLLGAADNASQTSIRQAAIAAAYFSQGRKEDRVDVSYTPVKQIRRPRNAKPGLVLKQSETVITVRPALFRELQPQLTRMGE